MPLASLLVLKTAVALKSVQKPAPKKKKRASSPKLHVHGGMHWIICQVPGCRLKRKPVRVPVSQTRTCTDCFRSGGAPDIFLQGIDMGSLRSFIRDECPEDWNNSSVFC